MRHYSYSCNTLGETLEGSIIDGIQLRVAKRSETWHMLNAQKLNFDLP
jgi:hypothetical protein